MKECFVVAAYCDTKEKEDNLVKNIQNLKKFNLPIILSSHSTLNENIINSVDVFVYESYNEVLYQKDFQKMNSGFWYYYDNDAISIRKAFDFHHDFAFWSLVKNGFSMAKNRNFDVAYFMDFDVDMDFQTFDELSKGLINSDICSYPLGNIMYTVIFSGKVDKVLNVLNSQTNFNDYFYNKPGKTNCERVFYEEVIRRNYKLNLIPKKLTDKPNFKFSSALNYTDNIFKIGNSRIVGGVFPLCNQDDNDNLYLWCNILENNDNIKIYVEYCGHFIQVISSIMRIGQLKNDSYVKLYANGKLFYSRYIEDRNQFKNMNFFNFK